MDIGCTCAVLLCLFLSCYDSHPSCGAQPVCCFLSPGLSVSGSPNFGWDSSAAPPELQGSGTSAMQKSIYSSGVRGREGERKRERRRDMVMGGGGTGERETRNKKCPSWACRKQFHVLPPYLVKLKTGMRIKKITCVSVKPTHQLSVHSGYQHTRWQGHWGECGISLFNSVKRGNIITFLQSPSKQNREGGLYTAEDLQLYLGGGVSGGQRRRSRRAVQLCMHLRKQQNLLTTEIITHTAASRPNEGRLDRRTCGPQACRAARGIDQKLLNFQ